ncbi:alpha-2-macroglobulin-like protein 1 isoform X4 [Hemicordylus capensis]|uniref:alpha-2-macroglobulin-like protein 1 isoform X4 n=1 Tax=Hemicordylus capensis TaxID=884348 RepID=UPI0023022805|nr:alpha-2-macroglobulin-like protein 1 isoform X4 [Hemicordylus capensis]
MGATMLLRALGLLSVTTSAVSDPHYLVAFPAVIKHPSTETFCVLLHSLPNTVHLAVTLEMTAQNHTLLEKDVLNPGYFKCTSFQVPAFVSKSFHMEEEEEVARVHVLIREDENVCFEGRKKVLVKNPYIRHLIEPDKPFYKPGETAKFRILRLDEEFKAIEDEIPLVELIDPNENRIGQWVNVKSQQGIVDLSFPLASEAALGSYTIKVGDSYLKQREFKVEEYVLPKYEVLLQLPPLVTTLDEEIQFSVCGKYTYGKPVLGNVHVTLNREISYYFLIERTNESLPIIEKEFIGQTDKTGCAHFTVSAKDLNLSQESYSNYIQVDAELEEKGTGMTHSGSDTIFITTKSVDVEFINLNPYYKHGFPYTGKMKFTVNEVPIKNQTVYLTVDFNEVETHFQFITDENGEAHFSLDTTAWQDALVSIRGRYSIFNVTQGDATALGIMLNEAFRWLKPFYSESNSFIEIQNLENELPCEKDQEVLVDYILDRKELDPAADHVDFYYLVVSRGKIVTSGQKQVPIGKDENLKGTFSLTLSVSADLAPIARLLLYAVFVDGEVAADVEQFTINKCFKHKVTLGFSEEEQVPGSNVNLQVEAAPGALCALKTVDKSVILKENETLTPEKIYNERFYYYDTIGARGFDYHLEDFEPYPCLPPVDPLTSNRQKRSFIPGPWYQSQGDVYSLFKQLRMKLLTNTKVKKPVLCDLPHPERRLYKTHAYSFGAGIPIALGMAGPQSEAGPGIQDSANTKVQEKPRTHFPETWIWDLVPINEEGKISQSVTIPDTITEWKADAFCMADVGFGLSKQATLRVFKPFFVDLLLPYSVIRGETFQLKTIVFSYLKDCIQVRVSLGESQQLEAKPCPTCHFTTCLCEDEAKTFSWNVTATELGHVNLSVTTEAEETHELCGNKISVTPPRGRSDTVVKSLLVKSEGFLEEKTQNALLCSPGGPVLEDVSLKLPEAVVKDSSRATISVIGYQRQLLYKHDDGSYSAFGKRDDEGNTWLTAFVVKAFGQAKSHIFVDEKPIQDAVHWLGQHQGPSGCFQSVGRLFNNALKGGVDNELSLTAYVTASLLELHQNNDTMVHDALHCLKANLSSVHDAYPRALLAYVFTLAGDTEMRQQLLRLLDEQADKTEGSIAFSDTETAAYYLLAVLSIPEVSPDEIRYASRIVRALTRQQNAYGGFSSTQDTVVALQGLSKYAALTFQEIESLKVLVKSSQDFQHEFHVDRQNRLLLQLASLPDIPGQYKVEVSGRGCAYVQTTLRFNHLPQRTNVFALEVETSPKECNETSRKHFDINLQLSYTGHRQTSNMALMEVNLLSGFIPVKKSLKWLDSQPRVKKVEFDPGKISIYLDWLDSNVQSYSFSVEQEVEVTDLKPAIVKLYDYYHPDDYVVANYNAPCSSESTKEDMA